MRFAAINSAAPDHGYVSNYDVRAEFTQCQPGQGIAAALAQAATCAEARSQLRGGRGVRRLGGACGGVLRLRLRYLRAGLGPGRGAAAALAQMLQGGLEPFLQIAPRRCKWSPIRNTGRNVQVVGQAV